MLLMLLLLTVQIKWLAISFISEMSYHAVVAYNIAVLIRQT